MAAEQNITGNFNIGPGGGGIEQTFSINFPANTTNIIKNIFITTDDPTGITLIYGTLSPASQPDVILSANSVGTGSPVIPLSEGGSVVCINPNNSLTFYFTLNTNSSNLFYSIHYI